MEYYSHFGHKDFILCLGYKSQEIKKFFLNYNECLSGDFVLVNGEIKEKLFKSEMADWKITFAETGLHSNQSLRLLNVKKYVGEDEYFLSNYSDGLTDLCLSDLIDFAKRQRKIACLITVKPSYTFHHVSADKKGYVNLMSLWVF